MGETFQDTAASVKPPAPSVTQEPDHILAADGIATVVNATDVRRTLHSGKSKALLYRYSPGRELCRGPLGCQAASVPSARPPGAAPARSDRRGLPSHARGSRRVWRSRT